MNSRGWVAALIAIAWLAGCSPGPEKMTLEAQEPLPVHSTDAPKATQAPSVTPRPTDKAPLIRATYIISTPTPSVILCSPLAIHPLEELSQIIGDPYKPPPPNKAEERHHGVDFGYYHWQDRDTMLGEPVQAALSGVVAAAIRDLYPYGNMVIIESRREHLPVVLLERVEIPPGEALYILYAHLNLPPLVTLGEKVEACQPLGEVGMSGNTDIPHLHLETRLGPRGTVFESMRFYDTSASQMEMDNYLRWRTGGEFRHFDPLILLSPFP